MKLGYLIICLVCTLAAVAGEPGGWSHANVVLAVGNGLLFIDRAIQER